MKPIHISINEDNAHFYANRTQEQMNEVELRKLVDQYAENNVDSIFFCTNVRRALFDSKSWEAIYHGYDPELGLEQPALQGMSEEEKKFELGNQGLQLMHNLWLLKQRGIDHHAIWLDQCRKRNIEGWLTVRMNDVHHSNNLDSFWHSTLWKTRPDLWRIQHKFESWWDRAFDYANEEVREHHFGLIKELLERYDPDGLELDWIRAIFHFAPGMEQQGCNILTQFVRDVKALVDDWSKKRGHKIKLSVRVPEEPESSVRLGMDVPTWIREELVDQIVLSQWLSVISFDPPVEIWRSIIGDRKIDISLNISGSFLPYAAAWSRQAGVLPTLDILQGIAQSAMFKEVDRLYFFNYCYMSTRNPMFFKDIISNIKSPDSLAGKSRRHFISSREIGAPGEKEKSLLPVSFDDNFGPAKYGRAITVYLNIGKSKTSGQAAFAVIGFDSELKKPKSDKRLEVRVNGKSCQISAKDNIPQPITKIADPVYAFEIPDGTLHEGRNALEINASDDTQGTIVWSEIYIKALNSENNERVII